MPIASGRPSTARWEIERLGTHGDHGVEAGEPSIEPKVQDRRAFLRWVHGVSLGAVLVACGSDDADVFAADDGTTSTVSTADDSTPRTLRVQTDETAAPATSATTADTTTTTTTDPASSSTDSTQPSSTTSTAAPSTETTPTSQVGGSGGALPAGGTMVVSFTYEQQSGGKNVPPYVAVWIEDGAGNLLTTVALWYQQFGRGERWLPDLTRWYNVDQTRIAAGGSDMVDAISSPTRSPGSFQVAWDGQVSGSAAPVGSYFVCIESARERGPYSLIRQSVNLDGSAQQQDLSSDGELVGASLAISA